MGAIAARRALRGRRVDEALRTLATDTFTRGDGASLGTAESGQTWQTIAGTAFGITSNQASNSDTTNAVCVGGIDAAIANGRVSCSVLRTTQVAGVAFRISDASNYWVVSMSGSNTTLVKTVAGSPTTVATSAITYGAATVVEVSMSGSAISVSFNGVVRLNANDSFNATATIHGIYRQQTVDNSRHDNFTVKQPVSAAAPLTRAQFLAQMSSLLGANQRVIYTPNNTDTTTSVESSTVGRTFTWDGDISSRRAVLGNGYSQSFNGTTQYGDTPDANDLSFGNGTVDSAFSILSLVKIVDAAATQNLLSKTGAANREYRFGILSDETLTINLWDESAGVVIGRTTTAALTVGAWALVGMTYDGRGGATAADGITLYVNGVAVAASTTNSASYVAMENLTSLVEIGARVAHLQDFLAGPLALDALAQKALTADEHWNARTACQRFFGVPL